MATGLPIVGMLDGEGATVITQAEAGLVGEAGSGQQLAERVRLLMAMPAAKRAAMGQRGRAYCEREFGRAGLMTALENWAAELIEAKTR